MTTFEALALHQPILRALADAGYTQPTPIQQQAIPALLSGRDLLGIAQTGTGKTAAFALPLLDRMSRDVRKAKAYRPRALILAPTRELAGQINDSIRAYAKHIGLRSTVVFGGVKITGQIAQMERGAHVLVATPGRLVDLMNQNKVILDDIEVFILDEADRMLDMGFQRDLKRVTSKLPESRQTMLFSATMPDSVAKLAAGLLDHPARVEITPQATTVERIDQQVLFVPKDRKRDLLVDLLGNGDLARVLVFTRTKHGADRVAKHLNANGISADAIHGNKAQNARQRALAAFKSSKIRALVATDIAARGIDVDGVTHVINFELPNEPDSYVHRIGRTARAGSSGAAISFCDRDERKYLRDIEKTIRQGVPVNTEHAHQDRGGEHVAHTEKAPATRKQRQRRRSNRRGGNSRGMAA